MRLFAVRPGRRVLVILMGAIAGCALLLPSGGVSAAPSASLVTASPETEDSDGDGDADRPDAASATEAAEVLDEPVENLSKRTETTRTFANPDGTWSDEIFATDVRVESADGEWEDVDYDLTENADGSLSPAVTASDVHISGGGTTEAARLTLEDGESMAISWPTVLPEPTVAGGVATYEISSSTDLIVSMTSTGVSTRIRLNSEPAADDPVFTLGLRTDDLDVEQVATGGLKMTNDSGDQVGATTELMAWDAATDEGGDPNNVVPVTAELDDVSSVGDITKHELNLKVQDDFLTAPTTQYPVTIDPDLGEIYAAADTWVRYGTTTPNGSSYRLLVGRSSEGSNNYQTLSYMKWPTSPMANFPAESKVVTRATMRLFAYFAGSCSPRVMNVAPLAAPFSETSTVYSNGPAPRSTDTTVVTENYGKNGCPAGHNEGNNDWVDADITKMVAAWAAGTYPADGLRMTVPSASAGDLTYERRFCSRNLVASDDVCKYWSLTPRLYVTYVSRPNIPSSPQVLNPDPTPSPGEEQLGCDVTLGNISTAPTVQVEVDHPEHHAVTPVFQWSAGSTVPDTAPTVDGTLVTPASGPVPATVTLPLPANADGQFAFRVKAKDVLGESPYSDVCTFTIDRSRPGNPTITQLPDPDTGWVFGQTYNLVFAAGGDDTTKTTGYALTINTANPPSAPQFTAPTAGESYTHAFTVNRPVSSINELRLWAFKSPPGSRSALADYVSFQVH